MSVTDDAPSVAASRTSCPVECARLASAPACRCARVSDPLSAQLAREHNDANVLALGARLIGSDMARACAAVFLDTDFAGGRHQRRVDQLSNLLQESD